MALLRCCLSRRSLRSRHCDAGIDYVKDTDVMPANISYFTHFSGNFWWTRADYWHSLADTIGPDYYDPERFLFTGKPRTACVYYTGFQVRAPPRCDKTPHET